MTCRYLAGVFFLWTAGAVAFAADASKSGDNTPSAPVSYYKEIRPIFQQHCQGCHQPAKPLGGYVMIEYTDLLKEGDRGQPGIVPGDLAKSMLIDQIRIKGGKAEMPKNRGPLLESQIKLIERWVREGAKDDTPASAKAPPVDADNPPVYLLPPVISSVAYSPDNQILAVGGYHEVLLHKADGSGLIDRLVGLSEQIQSIAFSPDGKTIAVAGGAPGRFGELQLWDVARRKLRQSIPVTFDCIYGVSWSHDGSKVSFGCADNTVRAIDATTGKQVLYQGAHGDWVLDTAFSTDSQYLVSVGRDRSVKLTEVATQRFIDNVTSITPGALKGGLAAVAIRPHKDRRMVQALLDDQGTKAERLYEEVLTAGSDGVPRLYKMHRETKRVIGDDANRIREYEGLPGRIYALAFNPDGSQFVAGSSLDGKGHVRIYNTNDGKTLHNVSAPFAGVFALAWRPDGQHIAAAGFDGTVRLIEASSGKVVKEFSPVPIKVSKN